MSLPDAAPKKVKHMADEITIIITDDHSVVRQGVRTLLETQSDFKIVGEAATGDEAVNLCADLFPDVVLLDLLMPGSGGVEATARIKGVSPATNIVVLTSYHDDEYILPAIKAGALSYLLKDVSASELIEAVRKAAVGETVLHPRVALKMMQEIQQSEKQCEKSETDLSRSEAEVLRLLADGLSNLEIGERLFISEHTVKSHVSNILGKLHLKNRTQAAIYAWRNRLL